MMLNPGLYKDFSLKAVCADLSLAEETLRKLKATFAGTDTQNDIYFTTAVGKLKLRLGKTENILIHYERDKSSDNLMKTRVYAFLENPDKKKIDSLYDTREVLGEFKKERKIYILDNIKIHLDQTPDGQSYIEIEAFDTSGKSDSVLLQKQCEQVMRLLNIKESDILSDGYFKKSKRIL